MKKTIMIMLSGLLLAALAYAGAVVDLGADYSQPVEGLDPGVIVKYVLPPGKACTTKAWYVGNKTGHTLQYADSVPNTTILEDKTVDTVILNIRFQVANYNLNAAFSATGYDSVAHNDTLIGHTAKTYGHLIDYSAKAESTGVRRHLWERWIIENLDTDTLKGLWLFPGFLP